jgi:non-specific serine/threonine protein kinase
MSESPQVQDHQIANAVGEPTLTRWPETLGAKEAATRLGVSERTIRRAIKHGRLAATKHGRRYVITSDALDRYRHEREWSESNATRPRLALLTFPSMERPRSALPAPLTLFVGREREIAAVSELLRREDVRLVTLTGPGGAGKTRLSLRVAHELQTRFADGAAFVPLAAVHDAELVPSTLALALGVRGGEERPPPERLLGYLCDRDMLLVLDNFEQLMDAGPPLVDLLVNAPRLKILVTSRSPLRLSGERVFAVPPLALPERPSSNRDDVSQTSLSNLAAVESVRLFVDRAEAATANFVLNAENAPAVAAICERADGLPLAIELAAARTALLSPAALLERLDRQLPLMTGGPRDQPSRLRTMCDAIAWSHDLLTPEERVLFRRLAVFVGGCTVAAAEAVGGDAFGLAGDGLMGHRGESDEAVAPLPAVPPFPLSEASPPPILDLLQRLVDQAVLVRLNDGGQEPRVGMLETIREFGLEQLAASGEEEATREAQAAWFLALAERAEPELAGPDQAIWVQRLEADLANIRAALDWLSARGDAERALRLAGAMGWLWSTAPYLEEARQRFDALIALPGAEEAPAALAKALASAGDVADWQGDQARTRAFFERALAIYRGLDDRWRMVSMLRGLGSSALDRGEPDLALSLLEESLTLARETGHAWEEAASINLIGTVVSARGDLSTALDHHEAAVEGWRRLGDTGHVTTALASAAWVALLSREWPRAISAYREALEIAVAGDDDWYISWCVMGAGGIAAGRGDPRHAAQLLAAGLAEQQRLDMPLRPHVQATLDQIITTLRPRLGEEAFAAASASGREMPIDAAITMAFETFVALEPEPGRNASPYGLTRRERDVLRLMAEGQVDKAIADALFVSRATASKHVASILAKIGVDTRTAAVAIAIRLGLA